MYMRRKLLLIIIVLISGIYSGFSQLSQGGKPRNIYHLKKGIPEIISMPRVYNDILRWQAEQSYLNNELKPLLFAHTFEVEFHTMNSGNWYLSEDGWRIWQLHLRSEEALSLNLIFEEFLPGKNDRLFILTPDMEFVLGAFGFSNITESGIFPVSPLPGDEVIVQFETPEMADGRIPFKISRINHDFLGIMTYTDTRRPLGKIAGECIPEVNCDIADRWREVQNSVCRIMIEGRELCTGALINNTAQNRRPFVLTANHCISTKNKASGSLFLFNYESPYCGVIDGDVSNSLAGSVLKATHDSLDFSLVELSVQPPASFRPYYAGWTRSTTIRDTVAAIHHSQGDIKKITIDHEIPVIASFGLAPNYTTNGFWRINRWDFGALESGASGGPLFNSSSQIIGSLVGGSSRCSYPFNDYFSRLNIGWDRNPDSTRQLKYWLDPLKINAQSIEGRQFNEGPDFCKAFTNLADNDTHGLTRISGTNGVNRGYYTGTNNSGITEAGDRFSIPGNERIHGVSVGIGRRFQQSVENNSRLRINVYDINGTNTQIIHTQQVLLKDLVANAMNFIPFIDVVEPSDSFMVSFNFEGIVNGDSVAIFHSGRNTGSKNTILLKNNGTWTEPQNTGGDMKAGALVVEIVACNVSGTTTDTTKIEQPIEVKIYPNPTLGKAEVSSSKPLTESMISVYNIHGQQIPFTSSRLTPRKMEIDISGNPSGIYLVRIWDGVNHFAGRIILSAR